MAQVLKFPAQGTKLGFKRVKKRSKPAENPNQLELSLPTSAAFLDFASGLSRFEHALMMDERGDARAAQLYVQAIAEEDCVADCYCNLGILESQRGNTAKAFDCFTTSLKHDPRHSEAHYNLGNLYFEVDDFRLAQVHYELAAAMNPSFASVYFNLALVQMINNDAGSAVSTLKNYQNLVSLDEGRIAEEMLQSLRNSLAAAKNSRISST